MNRISKTRPYLLFSLGIVIVSVNLILFATRDEFQVHRDDIVQKAKIAVAKGANFLKPKSKYICFEVANLEGEEGSNGKFTIQVHPYFAPKGAERFLELTEADFWNDCRFFRATPGVGAQFGINGDPDTQSQWQAEPIEDDNVVVSNIRRTVVFAQSGPNSRTTQILINSGKNSMLDKEGYAPIGEVSHGMDVVDRLYSGYDNGELAGRVPDQNRILHEGNSYLDAEFPNLSYVAKSYFVDHNGCS